MPDSTTVVPCNFGMWAGPAYAGGVLNPQAPDFVGLYENIIPVSFLDAAARQHDAVYEYAERVYGSHPTGQAEAMKNAVQFLADMDLLKNALRYRPDPNDFIGIHYRKMLVAAFYFQASFSYAQLGSGLALRYRLGITLSDHGSSFTH